MLALWSVRIGGVFQVSHQRVHHFQWEASCFRVPAGADCSIIAYMRTQAESSLEESTGRRAQCEQSEPSCDAKERPKLAARTDATGPGELGWWDCSSGTVGVILCLLWKPLE